MKTINRLLIAVLLMGVGFIAGVLITWQPLPLERIYEDYNHIRIHEDGSYGGETRQGFDVVGCIPGAPCGSGYE